MPRAPIAERSYPPMRSMTNCSIDHQGLRESLHGERLGRRGPRQARLSVHDRRIVPYLGAASPCVFCTGKSIGRIPQLQQPACPWNGMEG